MMILTKTPNGRHVREAIFDTKTGLQYQLCWQYPESSTYQEAIDSGTRTDKVIISSAHETTENSCGISYEGEEATDFWYLLITTSENMAER